MKTILPLLSQLMALLLCSCGMVYDDYLAESTPTGNTVHHKRLQSGGTYSTSRSDGSSDVNNMENSQKDGLNAATTLGIGLAGSWVQHGKNAATAATQQQAQSQAAALALQKEKDAAAAAAATTEVTKVAPGESVLQGGAILTAPK